VRRQFSRIWFNLLIIDLTAEYEDTKMTKKVSITII